MTHKQPFSNSLKYLPLRTIKLILEVLSNRIVGLPSNALLSCFISGLKPHIRREVQALQPINLTQAIAFAKLQEDKYNSFKKISPISQPNNTMPSYTKTVPPTATNLQPSLLPKPPTSLPIKTLTPAKLQSRREKGLCYNCDERYFPGHKCKSQFFLLLEHDDDDIPAPPTEPHTATDPEVLPQISLHAMLGHTSPKTLRLSGTIRNHNITILIDSSSTHNFIQERIVHFLNLPISNSNQFQVIIGNGDTLSCHTQCLNGPVLLSNKLFTIDFFILPISGVDLVLGVQWLKTLSPIITDYSTIQVEFTWHNEKVILQGLSDSHIHEVSSNQLQRLLHTNSISEYYKLQLQNNSELNTSDPLNISPTILPLITTYDILFQEPKQLPPTRQFNHCIHLEHGHGPVNVRSYRYPHFQKHTIETLVNEMLDSGIIRHSTSAFFSPILLV